MKDLGYEAGSGSGVAAPHLSPSPDEVREFARRMANADWGHLDDQQRIDLIDAGETLKNCTSGVQLRVGLDFEASQRREAAKKGVRAGKQGLGVAHQLALARRVSPHCAKRIQHLGHRLAGMPETFAALTHGLLSEERAAIIATHTECLSANLRERVDLAIAGDPEWLATLGNKQLEAEVDKLAYRLDPKSFVERAAKAVADRRVTSRPAPDTMMFLNLLLPVVQGVASYAALQRYATAARAAGDPRSMGQLMADRAVELLTGQATADAVPVTVDVMIPDTSMLGIDDDPAIVPGYNPIPAAIAVALLLTAQEQGLATLRRLYTHPKHGRLVAMESVAQEFPAMLAALIRKRDQICRQRWCDAPIRNSDHAQRKADGGPTSYLNGQGTCEACNQAKEAIGWRVRARPGPAGLQDPHVPHTIETVTPTGHVYTSVAPQVGVVRRAMAMEIYVAEDFTLVS
ncbi:13E12 repeat family protein [Nocardioides dilutus]